MKIISFCLALAISGSVFAKLPAPSDEAKLKALETKQKTAHGDKLAAYQLCKSQDKVAERYHKEHKGAPAGLSAPKCEDPGPFVFVPPEAAPAAAAPPAPPSIAPGGATTGKALPESPEKKQPSSVK